MDPSKGKKARKKRETEKGNKSVLIQFIIIPLAVSVQPIFVYPPLIFQSQLRQVEWIPLVDWLHHLADQLYIHKSKDINNSEF